MADFSSDLKAALLATSDHFESLIRQVVRDELVASRNLGDPDTLINAEEAARLLGMSPAALRRAAERGRFSVPPIRIGRRLRWRRGDLVRLLNSDGFKKASTSRRGKASISALQARTPEKSKPTHESRAGIGQPASAAGGGGGLT